MISGQDKGKLNCPECGAEVTGGRDGCQRLFDKLLAREFSDFRYAREHRLTVDVYALQHPDEYMRSAKSFVAHLTGIFAALETDTATKTNRAVQQWLSNPINLNRPDNLLPRQRGTITVDHIHDAINPVEHVLRVREWAESVWGAWSVYKDLAEEWIVAAKGNSVDR